MGTTHRILKNYDGNSLDLYIPINKFTAAPQQFAAAADWTPVIGDVTVQIDGGVVNNANNLPTAVTMGNAAYWHFQLDPSEWNGNRTMIMLADGRAGQQVEDTFIDVTTVLPDTSGLNPFTPRGWVTVGLYDANNYIQANAQTLFGDQSSPSFGPLPYKYLIIGNTTGVNTTTQITATLSADSAVGDINTSAKLIGRSVVFNPGAFIPTGALAGAQTFITAASFNGSVWTLTVSPALPAVSGGGDSFVIGLPAASRPTDVASSVWANTTGVQVSTEVAQISTNVTALPTATQNANALLDLTDGVESNLTLRQWLRLAGSTLFNLCSGLPTAPKFRDYNNTKNRISATTDANGNRKTITTDPN